MCASPAKYVVRMVGQSNDALPHEKDAARWTCDASVVVKILTQLGAWNAFRLATSDNRLEIMSHQYAKTQAQEIVHVIGRRNDAESAWNKTIKQLAGKENAIFNDSAWIMAAIHW